MPLLPLLQEVDGACCTTMTITTTHLTASASSDTIGTKQEHGATSITSGISVAVASGSLEAHSSSQTGTANAQRKTLNRKSARTGTESGTSTENGVAVVTHGARLRCASAAMASLSTVVIFGMWTTTTRAAPTGTMATGLAEQMTDA